MKSIFISCSLFGEKLSLSKLVSTSDLVLTDMEGKSNIGILNPPPSASFSFELEGRHKKSDEEALLSTALSEIEKNYHAIVGAGVDEIVLTLILEYKDQCNWKFSREQLKIINQLKLHLCVTCYDAD